MQTRKNETNNAELQQLAVKTVSLFLEKKNLDKAGHAMEHLSNLFRESHPTYGIHFSEDMPADFKYLCEQLLSLCCNPKVSKKIPVPGSLPLGEMLLRLVYFFENISDRATTAALHLNEAEESTNAETLDYIIKRYTKEMKE